MSSSFFFKQHILLLMLCPPAVQRDILGHFSVGNWVLSYTCVLTLKVMDGTLSCSSLRSISIMVPQQLFDGTKKALHFV